MTTLGLALSELKRMTRGTLPKLALIAVTCVPLLYGALYLYGNWDPQSNLSGIKTALVNLDDGAERDGKATKVGDEVVDSLLEDSTFDWEIVDSQQAAAEGVAHGDYAFAMTIPQDFSASLTSPAEMKKANAANLELTTNDANNFMASNFAKTLATEVRDSVSKEVGTETAEGMIAGFVDIHKSMGEAADGAKKLYDGTITLSDGVVTVQDGTAQLVTGGAKLEDGARALHEGTGSLSSGLGKLTDGQDKLVDGTHELSKGSTELNSGAQTLSKGLNTLESKTSTLPSSVSKLNDGTQKAASSADQLATGSRQVADGNAKLSATANDAISVIQDLQTDAETRLDQVEKDTADFLNAQVTAGTLTQEQADQISAKLKSTVKNSTVTQQLDSKVKDVNAKLSSTQEDLNQLAEGSEKVADGNKQLASGLHTLAQGTKKLDGSVPALVDGISSAASGGSQLADGSQKLAAGTSTLEEGQKSALSGTKEAAKGSNKLDAGAQELATGTGTLHDSLISLDEGVGKLGDGAHELTDGSGDLSKGLDSGVDQVPNPDSTASDQLANVIGDPLLVNSNAQTKAGAYGAGLAPFFMTLATWIGTFILTQVMRPVNNRALASNGKSWKIALGAWLPFAFISLIQCTALYAVVVFAVGLDPVHPWLTWALLLLASLCFSALIQGICALLGAAGKFVVLLLMVLQLVTAGGTFPWETLPTPLQFLHQILPMSNVVTALRHVIYGADLSMLVSTILPVIGYMVLGLLLSFLAVRKHKTWTLKTLQPELTV
ncbi:YhgE/Pip domain-containing protein [Glutamicibacter sp. BW77]|uniref:YhgE/Pip family protein n=1 Tax=Glutamicibacter bergerei TaxID=256702 RepID=A0ABV9MG82_9MICC|nr:YhgE/Pip domain-containing protein [Glutamicibacter sp. BW77]PCC37142.1 ABC transporter [Glutamicibacter sp. BW77]HBV10672.1 YhgE/Pip domain-containing protein [Micrococcaceae bacterium]